MKNRFLEAWGAFIVVLAIGFVSCAERPEVSSEGAPSETELVISEEVGKSLSEVSNLSDEKNVTPSFSARPEAAGLSFLANQASEAFLLNTKYASFPGVPPVTSPGYASHPRVKMIQRAHGVCKYLGYGKARMAKSSKISKASQELIDVTSDGFGYSATFREKEFFETRSRRVNYGYSLEYYQVSLGIHRPTYFSHLECF